MVPKSCAERHFSCARTRPAQICAFHFWHLHLGTLAAFGQSRQLFSCLYRHSCSHIFAAVPVSNWFRIKILFTISETHFCVFPCLRSEKQEWKPCSAVCSTCSTLFRLAMYRIRSCVSHRCYHVHVSRSTVNSHIWWHDLVVPQNSVFGKCPPIPSNPVLLLNYHFKVIFINHFSWHLMASSPPCIVGDILKYRFSYQKKTTSFALYFPSDTTFRRDCFQLYCQFFLIDHHDNTVTAML